MTMAQVEKRLAAMELQLAATAKHLAEIHSLLEERLEPKPHWTRMIGAFADDPGMQEIAEEALRYREQDRKKAQAKPRTKRPQKTKS